MEGKEERESRINPRDWRFTWEAQSQMPTLKAFVFSENFYPSRECKDLQVDLKMEKLTLTLTWLNEQTYFVLSVPVPRVLLDLEAPINYRLLKDHIEIKLSLLLPVDHPIVSSFISELNSDPEAEAENNCSNYSQPLVLNSDVETLTSLGDVHFYCRKCSFELTKRAIRSFVEMPSDDWREAADNWFGSCCCSFGGISEKLVANYAKSYSCEEGKCLLSSTSMILHHEDVTGFSHPNVNHSEKLHSVSESFTAKVSVSETVKNSDHEPSLVELTEVGGTVDDRNRASEDCKKFTCLNKNEDDSSTHGCCIHNQLKPISMDQEISKVVDLSADQKLLLNGYLGNIFMLKLSGISKEIKWAEFLCPQCSSLLGAYPSTNGHQSIDGGIRFLKCYISSSVPGSSGDLFRKYTLERMFSVQVMENADEELSFRIKLKDLKTDSSMLKMILLNPNCWSYSGYCTEGGGSLGISPKIYLSPVIKVLFSTSVNNAIQSENEVERESQKQVEEMFMLKYLIEELTKSLESSRSRFPPSLSSLESLSVSYLPR